MVRAVGAGSEGKRHRRAALQSNKKSSLRPGLLRCSQGVSARTLLSAPDIDKTRCQVSARRRGDRRQSRGGKPKLPIRSLHTFPLQRQKSSDTAVEKSFLLPHGAAICLRSLSCFVAKISEQGPNKLPRTLPPTWISRWKHCFARSRRPVLRCHIVQFVCSICLSLRLTVA